MKISNNIVIFLLFILTSCDNKLENKTDLSIKICENYIKSNLKSPSTFKLIKSDYNLYKNPPLDEMKKNKTDWVNNREIIIDKSQYINSNEIEVTLEYDASNEYGTPIRSKLNCNFKVNDWNSPIDGEIMASSNSLSDAIYCSNIDFNKIKPYICNENRPIEKKNHCCLPNDEYKFRTKYLRN